MLNLRRGAVGATLIGALVLSGAPAASAEDGDLTDSQVTSALDEAIQAAAPTSADPVTGAQTDAGIAVSTTPSSSTAAPDDAAPPQAVDVTIPTDAAATTTLAVDAVDAGGNLQQLAVQLPVPAGVPGEQRPDGTVVYDTAPGTADVAVQALDDGSVRATVVIPEDPTTTSYRFGLDLPAGAEGVPADDGGIDFVTPTAGATPGTSAEIVLGHVDPAWAVDATGTPVPTSYELVEGALVQHVQTTEDTEYPVVADPHWTWGWTSGTVYFNRSETLGVAGGAISLYPVFGALPPPFNVVALWYAGSVNAWAISARIMGKCLKIQYGLTWSWRGATPGVTPGHYTGGWCR